MRFCDQSNEPAAESPLPRLRKGCVVFADFFVPPQKISFKNDFLLHHFQWVMWIFGSVMG